MRFMFGTINNALSFTEINKCTLYQRMIIYNFNVLAKVYLL